MTSSRIVPVLIQSDLHGNIRSIINLPRALNKVLKVLDHRDYSKPCSLPHEIKYETNSE
jgi:hypothetical protein